MAEAGDRAERLRRTRRVTSLLLPLVSAERLRVLLMLADGERTVGEIRAELGTTQPAVSYHTRLLRQSGFVASRRMGEGRVSYLLTEKGARMAAIVRAL